MEELFLKKFARRDFLKKSGQLCLQLSLSSILLDRVAGKGETAVKESAAIDLDFQPAYLKLHRSGELKRRAEKLWKIMEKCQLCPRRCGVNRLKGKSGFCRAPGAQLAVSSFHPHFGEERPLVGNGGSGTIFLTHCSLRCVFCQNWKISQLGGVLKEILMN